MTDLLLVLSGLTVLLPLLTAGFRDEEGFALYEVPLFVAMFVNGAIFPLVEDGLWGFLFLQGAIAAVAVVPAARIKLQKRSRGHGP